MEIRLKVNGIFWKNTEISVKEYLFGFFRAYATTKNISEDPKKTIIRELIFKKDVLGIFFVV